MKIFFISLASIISLAAAASAQVAAVGPGSVKMGKIQPSVVKTPEYTIQGGPQKRSTIGSWLEIEVPFDTTPEEIDELKFKYTVLIEKTLLDGEVTHVNIPAGREHYSVMYIPPRTLLKCTGGRPLTTASVGNIWVSIERQGQKLAEGSLKPNPVPNFPHQAGLLNKSETPFAPLFFDRYEAVKIAK